MNFFILLVIIIVIDKNKSTCNTSGNRIRQWHHNDCNKSWYCNFKLLPIYISKLAAINTPTTTKAGVVTALVTTSINGLKNNAKKQIPVTILANPVLAPTATPEVDSIYDVVVVVPNTEPNSC